MGRLVPTERRGEAIRPRQWVGLVGGREMAPVSRADEGPVDVATFRFPGLPARRALPPLDAHYISFTLAGAILVERELGTQVDRARFRPGKSLILPAYRANAWTWDGATDELHLYVSPPWLAEVAAAAGVSSPIPVERFAFDDPLLHALATALLDERRNAGVGGTLFRDAVAETIALRLIRTHCLTTAGPARPARLAPARLRRVCELIEERLQDDLSLDDLAAVAGLSRAYFARAFRQTTGQTPYGYLRERRVARAKSLLAGSSHGIADVAFSVGFRSQSHLGRVFRNATGMTPAEYRRRVRI
jgi:AraC family transcriptional regulator